VYVSGTNFLYYEEGNPRARICPDVYVVFGVPSHLRDCYMSWREGGKLPDVVLEFTSKKTRREDTYKKYPLYEQVLRVPEYFLFDPTGDYLKPRFQGYRLEGGEYVPLVLIDGRLHSERLGLDLVQQGDEMLLYDPARDKWLLTLAGQVRRAHAAEAEAARLREELEALRRRMRDRGD
jgi:Uma2 family endonuclease